DRSVSEARVKLAAAESERSAQNEELAELRRSEAALREKLQAVTDDVHGLEMQIYEKKLHLSTLLERAGEELGLIEDVLVAEYGPDVPVPADGATALPEPATAPEPVEGQPVEGQPVDGQPVVDGASTSSATEGASTSSAT